MPIIAHARIMTSVAILACFASWLSFANAAERVRAIGRELAYRPATSQFKSCRILRPYTNCPPAFLLLGETTKRPATVQSFKFDPKNYASSCPFVLGRRSIHSFSTPVVQNRLR